MKQHQISEDENIILKHCLIHTCRETIQGINLAPKIVFFLSLLPGDMCSMYSQPQRNLRSFA